MLAALLAEDQNCLRSGNASAVNRVRLRVADQTPFIVDVAKDGEMYMIAQGSGGGYGDVLERDPEAVAKDLELGRISPKVATSIYGVVWDPETFVVDQEATTQLRRDSRRARIARAARAARAGAAPRRGG